MIYHILMLVVGHNKSDTKFSSRGCVSSSCRKKNVVFLDVLAQTKKLVIVTKIITTFPTLLTCQISPNMDSATQKADDLRKQIAKAEQELRNLKEQLAIAEKQEAVSVPELSQLSIESQEGLRKWPLSSEEYKRYGRQMIVPNIGIQGMIYTLSTPPYCPTMIYYLE